MGRGHHNDGGGSSATRKRARQQGYVSRGASKPREASRLSLPWIFAIVLAAAPVASQGHLVLEAREPVLVEGLADFAAEGASVASSALRDPHARRVENATGRVEVWTWHVAHARADAPGGLVVQVQPRLGDAEKEVFLVEDATLALDSRGGPFAFVAHVGEGGTARVSGAVDGPVQPARLARTLAEPAAPAPHPGQPPADVAWTPRPGWAYVGNLLADAPTLDLRDAHVHMDGPLSLKVEFGAVSFVDASGRPVERTLGEESGPGGIVRKSRLVFEGRVAGASLPAGDKVGLAAPGVSWSVEGVAAWTAATGRAQVDGEVRRFEDADVRARGVLRLTTDPPLAGAAAVATRHEARGDFTLAIDGEPFPAAGRSWLDAPAARPASALALLAALGLLARWGLVVLYTRLAPEDVLAHPRRRALWDAARQRPGMRQRDLQHALGMAWGAFSFHLRILVAAGHLRILRQGAYALVVPAVAGEGAALRIGHPSTRAVYDALPEDGTDVPVMDLQRSVGFSRQRMDHHLRALEARGLARVRRDERGHRRVARTQDDA